MNSTWTLMSMLALPMVLLPGCSQSAADKEVHQAALAARIEKLVELPEAAGPLESYGRNYAMDDNGKVRGVYTVLDGPEYAERGATLWFKSVDDLPMIMDGGCSVISVIYDPKTGYIDAGCNGVA